MDEPAIEPWGDEALASAWTHPLGQGYAGPAIREGRVVVFHRVGDQERVDALDAKTGKLQWQTEFKTTYSGGVNEDKGPRCVPLIAGSNVYLFGAAGQLHCVDFGTGAKRWSRDAYGDLDGREGYFGAGSTPILVGDRLLVNIGGRRAGLAAFSVATGETLWTATDEAASYSSPTAVTLDDQPAVVFLTRMNTVAVDPSNGEVFFRFRFGQSGPTVNAATPLVFGDRLFVSSSYGVGARLARMRLDRTDTVWENDEVMSSQYTTCVYRDGYLYGSHGREDFRNGELRCVDTKTGRLLWRNAEVGVSHVILVRDRLLALNNEGKLLLVRAAPDRFQKLAEASLTPNTVRALPALSDGQFYFRDQSGRGGKLYAVKL
jgi:outer membrane protein assembly factor BamB